MFDRCCATALLFVASMMTVAACSKDDNAGGWKLECEATSECPDEMSCVDGYCSSGTEQPQPDGGEFDTDDGGEVDTDDGGEVDTGRVRPYECEGKGTCCEAEIESMMPLYPDRASASSSIVWDVHNGVDIERNTTLVGVFEGIRVLDAPIAVACPVGASELGLPCEIDRVVVFRHKDGRLIEFRVGLPSDILDALPTDVTVEIDYSIWTDTGGHRIAVRRTSGNELLLLIDGRGDYNNQLELDYPAFTVRLRGDDGDVGSALCVSRVDACEHVYRSDSLLIDADQTHELTAGGRRDFVGNGKSFRAWHVVSMRRVLGGWGGCTDLYTPSAKFAIAAIPE